MGICQADSISWHGSLNLTGMAAVCQMLVSRCAGHAQRCRTAESATMPHLLLYKHCATMLIMTIIISKVILMQPVRCSGCRTARCCSRECQLVVVEAAQLAVRGLAARLAEWVLLCVYRLPAVASCLLWLARFWRVSESPIRWLIPLVDTVIL
jgi:hypothetical protein